MKLFYSYAHADEEYRNDLEKHLSTLKQDGLIDGWHDRKILPGTFFQREIDRNLEDADIIVLLVSSDFLASPACQKETRDALDMREGQGTTVIPVIIRPCDWKSRDIGGLQALPKDGRPVSDWPSRDDAFLNIAEGITAIARDLADIEVRDDFGSKLSELEFVSENKEEIQIHDVFVFPNMVGRENDVEIAIHNFSSIWNSGKHILLRGDDRSGKTTICRKMFLDRIGRNEPTLLLSGAEIRNYGHENIVKRKFREEFNGDYDVWEKREGKMIIIDDFDIESEFNFLDFARGFFDYVFVTVSDDQHAAFYRSQSFLSDFRVLMLRPLGHAQQEQLIRKWKHLGGGEEDQAAITDSAVDRLENTINAIVFRNRIVPRYPFYVLSILQTYEAFMPRDLQITAYGHCYHVLIIAQLTRAGISGDDLDSAINCLSFFAFDLYCERGKFYGRPEFTDFLNRYREKFVIKEDTIGRLTSSCKPIIRIVEDGRYSFRYPFAYYYLLGYYLAKNMDKCRDHIERLTERSYIRDNTFILIFTIHHSHEGSLIEEILRHTMGSMGGAGSANLDRAETKILEAALREIPEKILTEKPVREARRDERDMRDHSDKIDEKHEDRRFAEEGEINEIYRALKNMEILGQILTNKYGSLSKEKIKEIIIAISGAGLRLVRLITSERRLLEFEDFIVRKMEDMGARRDNLDDKKLDALRKALRAMILILVYGLILKTSASLGRSELSEVIRDVAHDQGTTAYKLIDLFFSLNSAPTLDQNLASRIIAFLRDCSRDRNEVVRRIISLEVQRYCNTHSIDYRIRQRLLGELGLPYRPSI